MNTVHYRGFRDERKCAHVVKWSGNEERALQCRWDLANHSPDGPEWGYGGSGPAQLALALLADALGSNRAGDQLAICFYQTFKWRVISALAQELPWKMTQERVLLEVHDLIFEDLDYGASCVTDARDRLVSLDVNRLFDEAEERDADLGDFDMLEAQHIRKVDEEFQKVLNQTLGISSTVCDQLLKTKTGVDQPQGEDESHEQAGGITI
jgi:hypothetical protein